MKAYPMPLRIMSVSAVLVTLIVFSYLSGALSAFSGPYVVSDVHRAAAVASDQSKSAKSNASVAPARRIATLAPAISQMLVDMGKGKQIVGVSEFDASAPHGTPVVGTYTDINTEALLATKPGLILHMSGKDGPPSQLLELAKTGNAKVLSFPSPLTVGQIADILSNNKNEPSLESIFKDGTAANVRVKMLAQLDAIRRVTATRPRPATLLVIGTNPLMASGPKTVLSELLEIAGGSNAAAQSPVGAPTFDREAILGIAPEAVLALLPGAAELKQIDSDPRLAELKGLNIPAVTENRISLINDPLVLLPSSNVSRVAAKMAKAIHPELAQAIDRIMSDPSIGAPMADPKKKGSDNTATRAQIGANVLGPAPLGAETPDTLAHPKKANSDNPATRAQYIQ